MAHQTERGKPILCGHKCTNRADYDPGHFEEVPYVEVVRLTTRVVYDPEVCRRKEGNRQAEARTDNDIRGITHIVLANERRVSPY